jgi:hypothetical protein
MFLDPDTVDSVADVSEEHVGLNIQRLSVQDVPPKRRLHIPHPHGISDKNRINIYSE